MVPVGHQSFLKRKNKVGQVRAVIIALFTLVAGNAQTITEKDVAGTWAIKQVSFDGCGIDFEHDTVFLSDGVKQEMNAETSAAYMQKLHDGLNRFHDMRLILTVDGASEIFMDGITNKGSYAITSKEGVSYFRDEALKGCAITLPGKDMQWQITEEGQTMIMLFKKQ